MTKLATEPNQAASQQAHPDLNSTFKADDLRAETFRAARVEAASTAAYLQKEKVEDQIFNQMQHDANFSHQVGGKVVAGPASSSRNSALQHEQDSQAMLTSSKKKKASTIPGFDDIMFRQLASQIGEEQASKLVEAVEKAMSNSKDGALSQEGLRNLEERLRDMLKNGDTLLALHQQQTNPDPNSPIKILLDKIPNGKGAQIFDTSVRDALEYQRLKIIEDSQAELAKKIEKGKQLAKVSLDHIGELNKSRGGVLDQWFGTNKGIDEAIAAESNLNQRRLAGLKEMQGALDQSKLLVKDALFDDTRAKDLEKAGKTAEAQVLFNSAREKFMQSVNLTESQHLLIKDKQYDADMQKSSETLERSVKNIETAEKVTRTTRNVAVVAAATIAVPVAVASLTAGAATTAGVVVLTKAAAIGTGVGTAVGAASNLTEETGNVILNDKGIGDAAKDFGINTARDGYTSAKSAAAAATGYGIASKVLGAASGTITATRMVGAGAAGNASAGVVNTATEVTERVVTGQGVSVGEVAKIAVVNVGVGTVTGTLGGGGNAARAVMNSGAARVLVSTTEATATVATGLAVTYATEGKLSVESVVQNVGTAAVGVLAAHANTAQLTANRSDAEASAKAKAATTEELYKEVIAAKKTSNEPAPETVGQKVQRLEEQLQFNAKLEKTGSLPASKEFPDGIKVNVDDVRADSSKIRSELAELKQSQANLEKIMSKTSPSEESTPNPAQNSSKLNVMPEETVSQRITRLEKQLKFNAELEKSGRLPGTAENPQGFKVNVDDVRADTIKIEAELSTLKRGNAELKDLLSRKPVESEAHTSTAKTDVPANEIKNSSTAKVLSEESAGHLMQRLEKQIDYNKQLLKEGKYNPELVRAAIAEDSQKLAGLKAQQEKLDLLMSRKAPEPEQIKVAEVKPVRATPARVEETPIARGSDVEVIHRVSERVEVLGKKISAFEQILNEGKFFDGSALSPDQRPLMQAEVRQAKQELSRLSTLPADANVLNQKLAAKPAAPVETKPVIKVDLDAAALSKDSTVMPRHELESLIESSRSQNSAQALSDRTRRIEPRLGENSLPKSRVESEPVLGTPSRSAPTVIDELLPGNSLERPRFTTPNSEEGGFGFGGQSTPRPGKGGPGGKSYEYSPSESFAKNYASPAETFASNSTKTETPSSPVNQAKTAVLDLEEVGTIKVGKVEVFEDVKPTKDLGGGRNVRPRSPSRGRSSWETSEVAFDAPDTTIRSAAPDAEAQPMMKRVEEPQQAKARPVLEREPSSAKTVEEFLGIKNKPSEPEAHATSGRAQTKATVKGLESEPIMKRADEVQQSKAALREPELEPKMQRVEESKPAPARPVLEAERPQAKTLEELLGIKAKPFDLPEAPGKTSPQIDELPRVKPFREVETEVSRVALQSKAQEVAEPIIAGKSRSIVDAEINAAVKPMTQSKPESVNRSKTTFKDPEEEEKRRRGSDGNPIAIEEEKVRLRNEGWEYDYSKPDPKKGLRVGKFSGKRQWVVKKGDDEMGISLEGTSETSVLDQNGSSS